MSKKISQLPPSTTPLTGRETVPIVQNGSTVTILLSNIGSGPVASLPVLNLIDPPIDYDMSVLVDYPNGVVYAVLPKIDNDTYVVYTSPSYELQSYSYTPGYPTWTFSINSSVYFQSYDDVPTPDQVQTWVPVSGTLPFTVTSTQTVGIFGQDAIVSNTDVYKCVNDAPVTWKKLN